MQKYLIAASIAGNAMAAMDTDTDTDWMRHGKPGSNNVIVVTPGEPTRELQTLTYEQMARTPQNYVGETVALQGKVVQVEEEGDDLVLRVNITRGEYSSWTDTIVIAYHHKGPLIRRVLENDIIAVEGEYRGLTSYESIFHQKVTLPFVFATELKIWPPRGK